MVGFTRKDWLTNVLYYLVGAHGSVVTLLQFIATTVPDSACGTKAKLSVQKSSSCVDFIFYIQRVLG